MAADNRQYYGAQLSIDNKVIYYGSSFIIIDNISWISVSPIPPNNSWITALIIGMCSLVLCTVIPAAFLVFIICLIWLIVVCVGNSNKGENLSIHLNSGHNIYFSCKDRDFMIRVMNKLIDTIKEGTNAKYTISFKDCTIGEAFNSSTLS